MNFRLYFYLLLLFFFGQNGAFAQVIYGSNNYVEYRIGNLPILISVPHGGNITPAAIPNRTCNNPVTVTDAYTVDLAMKIDSVFSLRTGCRPHVVYCHLRRTKLDANRTMVDGACGNTEAEIAWVEYHQFIDSARFSIQKSLGNKAFYFDLHGHGHPIQRVELGYLLSDDELELDDEVLNKEEYVKQSSIQNLVFNHPVKMTHSQLLRGVHAFGSMLAKRSYPAVPSVQDSKPGLTTSYFSGGYSTARHTCFNPTLDINGIQVECNFANVRDSGKSRANFAEAFVDAVLEYMNIHFNINLTQCQNLTNLQVDPSDDLIIYPTVIRKGDAITVFNGSAETRWTWFDSNGKLIDEGKVTDQSIVSPAHLAGGIYLLKILDGHKVHIQKIIVAE